MTHDFEPLIDIVYHHQDRFERPYACFVSNHHCELVEKEIFKEDIRTFIDICNENLQSNINDITKLVYLRRYYEVLNYNGNEYQLISNMLHRREIPVVFNEDEPVPMTNDEIEEAITKIKEKINSFDYVTTMDSIKNDEVIRQLYHESSSNYEKLHLFRVLFEEKIKEKGGTIIAKFINEAFHIENDYIYQLNPCEYQLVPQYVIDECDRQMTFS